MNRKKKINQVLKAKVKKMNAKQQKSNKPKYVSKAERAAIAAKEAQENATESNETRSNETESSTTEASSEATSVES
ncbi:DUF2986 domain-containing protein [Cognaticolwellia mytili]|uniref:DUF2986 domain-containing protein n=1 Tax=Cognaticolwellia mytili TaxID=1888913 RepID=UPI000A17227B|nr:DUF2986 domain-containing protein [Cognaticolwellia mytili]